MVAYSEDRRPINRRQPVLTWSLKYIEQLKAAGKIKGFRIHQKKYSGNNGKNIPSGRIVAKHFKKSSKEKDWIAFNLLQWCNERAVTLEEEYKFHPTRKWRFDWCIPALKIAVEYEGIFSDKSGHTTKGGYIKDTEKYNAAAGLGWRVFRFTANNYMNLIIEISPCRKI